MSEQPHFPLQKLGEIVEVLDHLRIPVNSEARGKRKGDVPYYGANGLQGWIDEPLFNEPLILMAEDGGNFDDFSTRPIAYRIDGPAWVNNHAHIIKVDNPKLHSFIYWSVAHKDIRKHVAGGTRQKLNQSALKEIEIPCPPNDEGAVVGKVLDTLDTQIEQTEALIAKLEKVKEGLLHDLLTRGIDENGQLRPSPEQAPELYKESPLGLIPREWDTHSLSTCSLKISDRDHTTPVYVESGFLMVSPVNFFGYEGIDFDNCKKIPRSAHEKNRKKTDLSIGDVIIHRIGAGLGRVRVVRAGMPEFSILHSAAQIRPNPNFVTPEYLLWSLRLDSTLMQMELGTQSIGVPDLGLDKIGGFLIPVAPTSEQIAISKILSDSQSELMSLSDNASQLRNLKSGLMDDLLTGRVRVTPLLNQAQATTPA
ncbi:restriction endonuclease subunit S [Cobetia crustatorum]|uniref:restriction endonuclease subunit S n=1 Tax=Cobetia crustatorum TaxID=553385 RepID=UPI00046A2187|nr:restriction endonuclease subunit S [Cobetia crustatorum]